MSGALHSLQSVAGNDGQQSALISNLFEIFLGVTGFFYLLVIVFLVWAIVRRRRGDSREPMLRRTLVVWVGIVALTLGGLSIATWLTDRGLARAGYDYVTAGPCASCHAIAGTPASGQVGPDLSHVASRRSLAAGTLAMNHANLARWIADPQQAKPGNNMPDVPLDGLQLAAV